jgi:N-glycosylase/DNA lyase
MAIKNSSLSKDEKVDAFSQVIRLHKDVSEQFLENQNNGINTWNDAWRELIYCVLAGTQISTNTVQKSYFDLNGYRFYNTKAKTLINAASYFENLIKQYPDFKKMDWYTTRIRLIKNVNGIGNKIASHWLRNIGFSIPIIDIHVRRVLCCAKLLNEKYSKNQITEKEYLDIEKEVIEISKERSIDVAKLDYILWQHGKKYCSRKACHICPLNL